MSEPALLLLLRAMAAALPTASDLPLVAARLDRAVRMLQKAASMRAFRRK